MKSNQKILIALILFATLYTLYAISKYWFADIFYNKGRMANTNEDPDLAIKSLTKAINLSPNEPLYRNEIAKSFVLAGNADSALSESQKAISFSPANANLKRSRFSLLVMLSATDPSYLIPAGSVLIEAIEQAPTDAKLYYNLALVYARTGQIDKALETLQKTIELKANYKEARLAYAFLLIEKKQNAEAREQLEYILKFIDPNDSLTLQTLESLK